MVIATLKCAFLQGPAPASGMFLYLLLVIQIRLHNLMSNRHCQTCSHMRCIFLSITWFWIYSANTRIYWADTEKWSRVWGFAMSTLMAVLEVGWLLVCILVCVMVKPLCWYRANYVVSSRERIRDDVFAVCVKLGFPLSCYLVERHLATKKCKFLAKARDGDRLNGDRCIVTIDPLGCNVEFNNEREDRMSAWHVCEALSVFHKTGLVHRDARLSNIVKVFVDSRGYYFMLNYWHGGRSVRGFSLPSHVTTRWKAIIYTKVRHVSCEKAFSE